VAGLPALFFTFFDSAHFKEYSVTRFFERQNFGDSLFGISLDG
jgi:hypothetical protein